MSGEAIGPTPPVVDSRRVLIVNGQIGDSLNRDAQEIDLVVGAKGSPIQLMLAGIFHLDVPTGNIPLSSAQELAMPIVAVRTMNRTDE